MNATDLAPIREAAAAVDAAADALAAAVATYDEHCRATVLRMKRDGQPVPAIPALTRPRDMVQHRLGSDPLLAKALDLSIVRPPIRLSDLLAVPVPARQSEKRGRQ